MTLYSYPITVEREGKRYYTYSDDLPGVYGLGKSIEEAKKSILQAMRQAGSHLILKHPTRKTLVIPVHAGDLPKGLFLKILKDAGFTLEEFRRD